MGGGGDDVAIFHGVGEVALGDETAGVADVAHEDGTALIGDGTHALPVDVAAVSRTATDDQFGLVLHGTLFHLVVVDGAGVFLHAVVNNVEHQAAEVDRAAVAEVATVVEVHTHEGVASLEACHKDSHVGLSTAVGLHVSPFSTIELLGTFDSDGLALVHYLATAIVTFSGIALGIFVGHDGTHGFHHLVTYEILRGNEFNAFGLTFSLLLDEVENLSISLHIKYMY